MFLTHSPGVAHYNDLKLAFHKKELCFCLALDSLADFPFTMYTFFMVQRAAFIIPEPCQFTHSKCI